MTSHTCTWIYSCITMYRMIKFSMWYNDWHSTCKFAWPAVLYNHYLYSVVVQAIKHNILGQPCECTSITLYLSALTQRHNLVITISIINTTYVSNRSLHMQLNYRTSSKYHCREILLQDPVWCGNKYNAHVHIHVPADPLPCSKISRAVGFPGSEISSKHGRYIWLPGSQSRGI